MLHIFFMCDKCALSLPCYFCNRQTTAYCSISERHDCSNLIAKISIKSSTISATTKFFFPLIFGNLVATILFSLSSLPLNFGNLVATIGFFLSRALLFQALHRFGQQKSSRRNFGNLITKIQFFSHSIVTSFLSPFSSFFVRILTTGLPKFASLLSFPYNFEQYLYHK